MPPGQHPRHALGLVASALPAVAFQLWYNVVYFDDLFHTQLSRLTVPLWQTSLWKGSLARCRVPAAVFSSIRRCSSWG